MAFRSRYSSAKSSNGSRSAISPPPEDVINQKRPRMEKMFAAYPDCFQAIANKDEAALQTAISAASERTGHGEPLATKRGCHMRFVSSRVSGSCGWVEQATGRSLSISDDHSPPELLA